MLDESPNGRRRICWRVAVFEILGLLGLLCRLRLGKRFLRRRFARQLELRARGEVLNVVLQIPGTRQRLAGDVDLASRDAQYGADSQGQQGTLPGASLLVGTPHSITLRERGPWRVCDVAAGGLSADKLAVSVTIRKMTIGMTNSPTLTPIGKLLEIATCQQAKSRSNAAGSGR
jgi:hypothetical protein